MSEALLDQPFPQEAIWEASILALTDTASLCMNYEMLHEELAERLPFSSARTRRTYRSYVLARYFPDRDLRSLSLLTWRAYQDRDLLAAVMRHQFMAAEPVVDSFLRAVWVPVKPGTEVTESRLTEFFASWPQTVWHRLSKRLVATMQQLGYMARQGRRRYTLDLAELGNPRSPKARTAKTALLLVIHWQFARHEPATVSLERISERGFHHHLGFRSLQEVAAVMREAEAADLVAKYVTVDQLNQVTTRYSFDEFAEQRCRFR